MKNIKSALYTMALLLFFTACKKDILNSVPLDKYSDAVVWQDMTLVNLYVNRIYSSLTTEYDRVISLMLASITDEAKNNRSFAPTNTVILGQFTASNSPYNSVYTSDYTAIRLCNLFLEKIGSVPGDKLLKNRLAGEVRFLRAFLYHDLYNYFGRFPIISRSLSAGDEALYTKRGTDEECIDFILADLDSAALLLPVKYTGNDVGRVTKGACLALKSRVLLYAGKWQQASDAALEVINLNTYSLFPDYAGIFYPQNDNNAEVIFDRQYISNVSTGPVSSIDAYNTPPNFTGFTSGVNNPTQNLVDLYEMKDGTTFDWNNPEHTNRPYFNRDPRMYASIMYDSTNWQGQIVDMKLGSVFNPSNSPSTTGYYMKKFLNPTFNQATRSTISSSQNFIFIRYAEVLLNYAEAQFKLGNTETARQYVNMVRIRPSVNMPAISTADFSWERYTRERQIELAFEGTRLWDIRRWKIGPQALGAQIYKIVVNVTGGNRSYSRTLLESRVFLDPQMYLFPIPQSEIDKYPNHQLEQNEGW